MSSNAIVMQSSDCFSNTVFSNTVCSNTVCSNTVELPLKASLHTVAHSSFFATIPYFDRIVYCTPFTYLYHSLECLVKVVNTFTISFMSFPL